MLKLTLKKQKYYFHIKTPKKKEKPSLKRKVFI